MRDPRQLDMYYAEINQKDGTTRAVLNADCKIPAWGDKAFNFFKAALNCLGPENFMMEEIRAMAFKTGFPAPPSDRAWGSVVQRAVREELIEFVGYSKTKNPLAHRTPAAMWRKK